MCVAGVIDPLVLVGREQVTEEVRTAVRRVSGPATSVRVIWAGGTAMPGAAYPAIALAEVVAESESEAMSACAAAKQYLLHASYDGLLNNGGNVAFPFSPEVVSVGAAYEFSVYHLLELDDPSEVGVLTKHTIGANPVASSTRSPGKAST
jgi:hypothetical protein